MRHLGFPRYLAKQACSLNLQACLPSSLTSVPGLLQADDPVLLFLSVVLYKSVELCFLRNDPSPSHTTPAQASESSFQWFTIIAGTFLDFPPPMMVHRA